MSEPPHEILVRDVNKLLSYLHDVNAARDTQHEELTDHLRVIEDELLDLSDMLRFNRLVQYCYLTPLHTPLHF